MSAARIAAFLADRHVGTHAGTTPSPVLRARTRPHRQAINPREWLRACGQRCNGTVTRLQRTSRNISTHEERLQALLAPG
jgi:hypothetical protein